MRGEIEKHFEQLLTRDGLAVHVVDAAARNDAARCMPFDYTTISKYSLKKDFVVPSSVDGTQSDTDNVSVNVFISALPTIDKMVRFFGKGRSINEVGKVQSFMRFSQLKETLWNHP